jgi:6-pyruvoyltetrahydropterin/6-carboxytetrahydropterin synthase
MLDDVAGLGPATLENLCAFIWRALLPSLPQLSSVRVWRDSIGDSCTLRARPVSSVATAALK